MGAMWPRKLAAVSAGAVLWFGVASWPVSRGDVALGPDEPAASEARSDFNGDGFDDLAVGVPFEKVSGVANAGAVNVLYGSADGLQASAPDDQFWTQSSVDVEDEVDRADEFGSSLSTGDFNGDGFGDLAVGVPFEDLGEVIDAGGVNVLYGSAAGLQATAPADQFWTQDSADVEDVAGGFDQFGSSVGSGDFNHDGFDDLAIGVPYEEVSDLTNAGAVNVLYGSANGLQTEAPADQLWTQDSPDVDDQAGIWDFFGWSLFAGDFNADGISDLAIGTPLDNLGSITNAGLVNVLYGSDVGLQALSIPNQTWNQDSADVQDDAEPYDEFGSVLAGGDFNGDGADDLAIGVTAEDVEDLASAAAVNVLYGSAGGLQAQLPANQFWTQDSLDVQDKAETQDRFGWSLSVGDYNADGFADLAIGARLEDLDSLVLDAGAVNVLFGSLEGLQAILPDDQFWNESSAGMNDLADAGDRFGRSVASGDFNGDGFVDLAIGAPNEFVNSLDTAGHVNVLYGTLIGLQADLPDDQVWTQDNPSVKDKSERHDKFGETLASAG